jgi:hypothetical protein
LEPGLGFGFFGLGFFGFGFRVLGFLPSHTLHDEDDEEGGFALKSNVEMNIYRK